MAKKDVFVGIDVGTSSVRCVMGHQDPSDGSIAILGMGTSQNTGMRKGVVTHPEEVSNAIAAAVEEAERVTGTQVRRATININGAHVESLSARGVVAISNADHLITEDDRYRVEDAATIMQLPPNREIIQLFAKNYLIDGQSGIKNPVGMQGIRLEADVLIMTASTPILRNLEQIFHTLKLDLNHRTTSGLASAEALLDRQSREAGSAAVDIGYGTTNVAVMSEGEVEYVAVIPVGGMHITNDIAIGLKTELELAEKIKCEYLDLSTRQRGSKHLSHHGHSLDFRLEDVQMIVEARIEEMAEHINAELKKAGFMGKLPGGVVLSGGGSKVIGLDELLKQYLGLPVHKGELANFTGLVEPINRPEYHTAAGLMVLDMLLSGFGDSHLKGAQLDRISSGIKKLFKRKNT